MNEKLIELLLKAAIGQNSSHTSQNFGQNIVVLDRGFVYVGQVQDEGDYLIISDAQNIRQWGTTKGLGELANGPLSLTKLDKVGSVRVPKHALQHLIPCKGF